MRDDIIFRTRHFRFDSNTRENNLFEDDGDVL